MDVFDLVAKLKLDSSGYEEGLQNAEKGAFSFGDIFKANIASDLVSKGFDMAVEGVKKLGSSFVDIGKQAFDAYGSLQQNIGGVQKLYGDAADTVLKDSKEAFKTAGMSANEYMETATQFSASLIGSLNGDTQKAAEQTKIAMAAMSDNVNTFGTNAEDVTNAFKGFSKQNYTMLDNLKLGYGGTKSEMERLIKDANEWGKANGEASNLSINSFSDVVTAIQQIQEKQHIAGTTAKEAGTTIQGSIGMAKAAWENLLSSLADPNGDIKGSINDLITSIFGDGTSTNLGVIGNALPAIETAIEGIGDFIAAAAPYITKKVPELIAAILPDMVSAGLELLSTVGQTIINTVPALMSSIFSEIDSAISNSSFGGTWDSIKTSITTAIEGIKGSFDTLVTALSPITEAVDGVVEKFQEWIDSGDALNEATELFSAGIELVGEGISLFLEGLTSVIDYGVQFTEWLTSGSDGADAFMAVLTGIATVIGLVTANMAAHAVAAGAYQVAMMAVQGVTNLVTGAQAALNAVMAANPIGIVVVAIAALVAALVYLYNNNETVRAGIDAAWQGIKTAVEVAIEGIKAALYAIGKFIVTTWETVTSAVETAMNTISIVVSTAWNAVGTLISTVLTTISTTITTIWSTILSTISTKMDNINTKITTVWTTIKTSIASAITLIKSTVTNGFTTMVSNLTTPLTNMKTVITGAFNSVKETVSGVINSALTWGSDLINNFVSGIKNNIYKVGDAIGGVADKIKSLIGFSEPEDGPLSRFHTFAPDMMELFAQGIDQSAYLVTDALKRNFDFYDGIVKPLNMNSSALSGLIGSRSGDFNETINIYAPTALDPSEVARQTRKANREMMLALRGI